MEGRGVRRRALIHGSLTSFTTARLRASRLSIADVATLSAMHRDPRVMATLGGVRTAARTRRFVDANVRHWERYGFGLWMFRDPDDGRFVGRGGLRHVTLHGCPEVEIAYAVSAEFWGRGLGTEIGTACVAVAEQLGLPNLVAFTLPHNRGSRRVMEKLAFRYEREIVHAGLPHVLYRRSA